MSEDIKKGQNKTCQICHSYLFEDDDVVVCPICGAPYHRDCYETLEHCALEKFHGTDQQYDKVIAAQKANTTGNDTYMNKCPNCGEELKENCQFCPHCGKEIAANDSNSYEDGSANAPFSGVPFGNAPLGGIMFDIYGGVPKNENIDGVTADEVAKSVIVNTPRYVRKFFDMFKTGKKVSWNWAAFIKPSWWSFYRKMYWQGAMFIILEIAAALCNMPFMSWINSFNVDSGSYQQILNIINNSSSEVHGYSGLVLIGLVIWLASHIIAGIFGDRMYMSTVINRIKSIKSKPDIDDTQTEIIRKGGVNILLIWAAILAEMYLPYIIYNFIS